MKVKIIEESYELDLEASINIFLKSIPDEKVIDIKYQLAIMNDYKTNEQIYCYTALIIYK